MVVSGEELVARLGFEVFGEQNLRRVMRLMQQVNAVINRFAAVIRQRLGRAFDMLGDFGKATGGLARFAAIGARGLTVLGAAAVKVAGPMLVAYGAFKAASGALAIIGANAAAARRNLQLLAGGMGTTAARSDQMTNAFSSIMGTSPSDAAKEVDSFLKKIGGLRDEAIQGDEAANEFFVNNGLKNSITEKDGMPRDTALIGLDAIQAYKALQAKLDAARAKGNSKLVTKLSGDMKRFEDKSGMSPKLGAGLREKSMPEIEKDFREANRRNPTQTPEQEARDKKLAEQMSMLTQNFTALGGAVKELAKSFAVENFSGILNFSNALVEKGKDWNLIPRTAEEQAEVDARKRDQTDAAIEKSNRAAQHKRWMDLNAPSPDRRRLDTIRRQAEEIEQRERTRQMRDEVGQSQRFRSMPAPVEPATLPTPVVKPEPPAKAAPAVKPDSSLWDRVKGWLSKHQGITSTPESLAAEGLAGLNRSVAAKVEQSDNRKYDNIGNDQRQVSVTVNATVQGMSGLGTSVQGAVAGALVKGSNASTDVITAP